jgi:putative oxidoreductase
VTDVALLALRLWLGIVMLAHGYHHARSQEGTIRWFDSKGFRHAGVNARLSALGELGIGAGLALGLLTPVVAAGLVATMAVAFWSIHRFAGFFVFKRPDEGWEYVATLSVTAAFVAAVGPGRYSLDAVLGWADNLDGWVGLAIIAAGLAVAAIQLAATWRRPT